MTKRLILIRHAKSAWDDPFMSDHDRPLNARGRESATAIGGWLKKSGYDVKAALVSSAERTRETWDNLAAAANLSIAPDILPPLYLAEPDLMLNILKDQSGDNIALIAHNPGIAYLAHGLLKTPPSDSRFDRFPTGTTCVIDLDIDAWSSLTWRAGVLTDLAFPRDLVPASA
ncbi:MAG: SixA phosphatase family protein [Maritimibacter sp.]